MRRIVVTGATSMIGVALIEIAIKNKIEVLAVVRENSNRINRLPDSELIEAVSCDVEKLSTFPAVNKEYDVFYHFAWNFTDKEGRANPMLQARNIVATLDAVELANRLGCKKFVGAGSQAEYGYVEGVISPNTYTKPVVAYGIAKSTSASMSELLCNKYGITFVWGRIFSVYGKYDNDGTLINYAVDQFLKGKQADFSSGVQMWNYLNEKDAGRIFYLLGELENIKGIYCVANSESIPLKEYIIKIAKIFGDTNLCKFASFDPTLKQINLIADVTKLTEDTSFEPQISFEEGIEEVIEYRRNRR